MHYPSYDGDFFQACAMQAIFLLFMKFQCVICILYQNLLPIQVYMLLQTQDSTDMIIITLVRIHYSMQESFTLHFREVLIIIWCMCTTEVCHIMPSSSLAHKNTQLIVYKEVRELKSKQSACCLFLSTNNYKTVIWLCPAYML
jgi:hypothetical protein